jgi:formylglycine-generating enzyme required for sulfatase activity
VARGGAFATDPQFVRNTNRFSLDPARGYTNVGFRCVTSDPRVGLILLPTLTPAP